MPKVDNLASNRANVYHPVMELLTVKEAAAILKLTPYTVARLLREKRLPGIKIGAGQQWRIRRSDLDAYLSSGGTPDQYPDTRP
jgi:excisionase family DNA binding protein